MRVIQWPLQQWGPNRTIPPQKHSNRKKGEVATNAVETCGLTLLSPRLTMGANFSRNQYKAMSINLLELMQGAVGNQLIDRVAGIVGEDSGDARKAVGGILPSLLGGLISTSSTPEGADHLASVVDQADGTIIDNIDKILDGADGGSDRLLDMGNGLVNGLLGNKLGGVVDLISNMSGLGKSGVSSLLGMITPLIFSLLGKQKNSLGLDASGLANLLKDQAPHLKGLLPPGMSDALGLAGLDLNFDEEIGVLDKVEDAVVDAAGDAVEGAKDLAGNIAEGTADAAEAAVDGVRDAAGNVADAAGDAVEGVKNVAGNVAEATGDAVEGAVEGTKEVASNVADTTADVAKSGFNLFKFLLPLIILIALVFLAWKFLSGGGVGGGGNSGAAASVAQLTPDNALSTMKAVFSDTKSTLRGIKDEASAKAAVPQLDDMTSRVKAIAGMKDLLPAGVSDQILKSIKGDVPQFQGMVEKAYAIPGVKGILEPKVNEFMDAFSPFQ